MEILFNLVQNHFNSVIYHAMACFVYVFVIALCHYVPL